MRGQTNSVGILLCVYSLSFSCLFSLSSVGTESLLAEGGIYLWKKRLVEFGKSFGSESEETSKRSSLDVFIKMKLAEISSTGSTSSSSYKFLVAWRPLESPGIWLSSFCDISIFRN